MNNLTFGKKIAGGFAGAVLMLLLIAVAGYRSTHILVENNEWVDHTHQVRREFAELLSLLKDAEVGQRGFVITGADVFLEPHRAALSQIDTHLAEVRRLTADNPSQQRRLDELRAVVDAKLTELASTIDMRRTQGLEATAARVAEGSGRRMMDQIRRVLHDMDLEESNLLARRADDARKSAIFAKDVIVWGSAFGVLFVVLIGWFITDSLVKQVGSAVQRMQSSSVELQSAANQQATATKEQATAMGEISTTITELLATSRQIAESAQRVAQIAEQTSSSSRSGDGIVERAHESIAAIRRQVDLIVSHMLELGKKSQQIGAVLEIVAELAEQTNILAINATIEAAGSGEAGKRFAVVADEIRKLADRVAGSTKEIRGLIDDVRGSVNATVMTTETGSKAVDAGTRQFLDVAAAFKQINAMVGTTTEAAKEIELSTKQQSTAVEQVNVAIVSIAQTTREAEASAGQTLQTAAELSQLSHELLRIVQPQGHSIVR